MKKIVSIFVSLMLILGTVLMTGVSAATALASTKLTKVQYNAKKKSVKLTWKKVNKAKGYVLELSTAKKFKKKATKTYTIKKNKTVTKTVKKLKVGKKYFARIRAFKVEKVKGKKKTVYSKYSPVKNFVATEYVAPTTAPPTTVPPVTQAPQKTFTYPPAQGLNDKTVGVSKFVSELSGYEYTLKFIDDFDGTTLNNKNWRISNDNANGAERQQNVDKNVVVENGKLRLFARAEEKMHQKSNGDITYHTGSKIDTSHLICYKYGRIEMYAKLPPAEYSPWPAFWSLGYGQWPMVGEIDIMEMCGSDVFYTCTLHFTKEGIQEAWLHDQSEGFGGGSVDPEDKLNNGYHVIGIEWTPDKIYAYCNGEKAGESDITKGDKITAFRNYEHFMILNYALGGMGGSRLGPEGWVDSMDVDWVKIWQTDSVQDSVYYTGMQKDELEKLEK